MTLAERPYPFPSRTRKSSSPAPKILRGQPFGKIGRRQDLVLSGGSVAAWLCSAAMNMADRRSRRAPTDAPRRRPPTARRPRRRPRRRPGRRRAAEPTRRRAAARSSLAEAGGWRLDLPSRDHRCAAFSPPAPLSPEKQARLCLTAAHTTLRDLPRLARRARTARLGAPPVDRATRWGLARTTTRHRGPGRPPRARCSRSLLDRRRWPAIPRSSSSRRCSPSRCPGFRAGGPSSAAATASPTPDHAAGDARRRHAAPRPPTAAPTSDAGRAADRPPPTAAPTAAPTRRGAPADASGPTRSSRATR